MPTLQVTCSCTAYAFPHRIGGGICSGSDWSSSYRQLDGEYCQTCNCLARDDSCDVAQGAESIIECEGYQDYLHTQTSQRHPISLSDFLAGQYSEYAGAY